jgi:hypothetical protein
MDVVGVCVLFTLESLFRGSGCGDPRLELIGGARVPFYPFPNNKQVFKYRIDI